MIPLSLGYASKQRLVSSCVGSHSDDIETQSRLLGAEIVGFSFNQENTAKRQI